MSFYVIHTEHDMDKAVKECISLMNIKTTKVKLAFNNMGMVNIFLDNLTLRCEHLEIDPELNNFNMDVLVNEDFDEEGTIT